MYQKYSHTYMKINKRFDVIMKDLVHIQDSSSGPVLIGQNITINCSIEQMAKLVFWTLNWRVSVTLENKSQHIKYGPYDNGSIKLHIQNVSTDDEGDYICIATAFNGVNYSKTYKLNAYPNDINYTNLIIDDDLQKKIRPAGYESVRWTVIISSIGNTRLHWRRPNSHISETKSANTCVTYNCVSELIVRNLKLSDSGVYKLAAYNGAELNEINVTLTVEEKPTVLFIKGLRSNQSYYEFENNYSFVFFISGYPLPSVECVFKKCPHYPMCKQSHSDTQRIKGEIIQVSKITKNLVIIMNVTDTGTLVCFASNSLGNHSKQHTILVTGPRKPVINNSSDTNHSVKSDYGEQVVLKCSAIGMPHPTVSWYKDGRPWPFEGNYSRVLIQSGVQTVLIDFTERENENTYKCNASNQFGSSALSYVLKLKKLNYENQIVGVVFLCSVIAILLGILMIGIVIGLSIRKTRINTIAVLEMYRLEEEALIHGNMGIPFQWSFPIEKLELGKRLGSGEFGVVYKAKAEGIIHRNIISDVAVKTTNANTDSCCIKALESELKMMINIGKHSNIVNLLGLCTGRNVDKKLMIIVEYCRYGCIDQYIKKHRECFVDQFTSDGFIDFNVESSSNNPINANCHNNNTRPKINEDNDNLVDAIDFMSNNNELIHEGHSNTDGNYNNRIKNTLCTLDLIQWSYQVAKGMDFLASKKILHGDLAARNILLADDNIVKISDFGLSKTLSNSGVYKKRHKKDLLPFKWMAIESIKDLVFSTQSDVWSFGIVVWEMFSLAATPYPNLQLYNLYDKLVHGYRMDKPKYSNSIIYNMMMECWEADPKKRPSFADLTNRLGDLLQDCTKSDYANFNEFIPETTIESLVETDPIIPVTASTSSN